MQQVLLFVIAAAFIFALFKLYKYISIWLWGRRLIGHAKRAGRNAVSEIENMLDEQPVLKVLLTDEFLQARTRFKTFTDFQAESGVDLENEELNDDEIEKLNQFTADNTDFTDFEDMVAKAVRQCTQSVIEKNYKQ